MYSQIAVRRADAVADVSSPSAKESAVTPRTMTRVQCGSCGVRYETPVDRKIVEAVRGCAQCGQRALFVVGV